MNSFWKVECMCPSFKVISQPLILLHRCKNWWKLPFDLLPPWRGAFWRTRHVIGFDNISSCLRLDFCLLARLSLNWAHMIWLMLKDWLKASKHLLWDSEFSCLRKFSKAFRLPEHPMAQKCLVFLELARVLSAIYQLNYDKKCSFIGHLPCNLTMKTNKISQFSCFYRLFLLGICSN